MAAAKPAPLKLRHTTAAPPAEVHRAPIDPTNPRDRRAGAGRCEPRPGGRLCLFWNDDCCANERFAALEPGKTVAVSRHGRAALTLARRSPLND